ncbi:hypothetical protein BCO_0900083 (plasmid) [Borrelia coriaceae ATCC 43381]|uniref:Uncharacterized protein n=1 Tax=Borrelia coriaceae ATCC 43381 TaxID=1408429 RepID=W5SX38_9SPIR|nr:hypothetical protein BCO_0900083 [Borrelia coriaceae ATCC 43381]
MRLEYFLLKRLKRLYKKMKEAFERIVIDMKKGSNPTAVTVDAIVSKLLNENLIM